MTNKNTRKIVEEAAKLLRDYPEMKYYEAIEKAKEMLKVEMKCRVCGKTPEEINEYVSWSQLEGITPEEFVKYNEGTYNPNNGYFYCTKCYIKIE